MKKKTSKKTPRKPTQLDRIEGNLAALRVDFGSLNETVGRNNEMAAGVIAAIRELRVEVARLADELAIRFQHDDSESESALEAGTSLLDKFDELIAQVQQNTQRLIGGHDPVTCRVVNIDYSKWPAKNVRCARTYLGAQCVGEAGHEGTHISEAGWAWNEESRMATPPDHKGPILRHPAAP